MEPQEQAETTFQAVKPGLSPDRKLILALAGAVVVVAVGMYLWKAAAVGAMEEQLAQAEAQHAQARVELIEQAEEEVEGGWQRDIDEFRKHHQR